MWQSVENIAKGWSEKHNFKIIVRRQDTLEISIIDEKRDDVLTIFKGDGIIHVDYINGASGATETFDCLIENLPEKLDEILKKSDDWVSFMSFGPGRGY